MEQQPLPQKNNATPPRSPSALRRRVFCFVTGIFTLALGVSFSVKANLGVSPVSSIPYTLSRLTGIDQGVLTALVFTLYVLLQIPLLRKEFTLKNLAQIICGVLFGSFVSFWNSVIAIDVQDAYLVQLALLAVSILFIACGLVLILAPNLVPQPPEGLMLAVCHKTGWPFPRVKVCFDCIVVGIAALAGLIVRGELVGVREGTIISSVLVGVVISFIRKGFGKKLDTFLLGKKEPENSESDPAQPNSAE